MSNLSDLLPSGAGGKSFDFVASGTLANGQAVALTSDGKVTAISSDSVATVFSDQGGSAVNSINGYFDTTQNKIFVSYADYAGNDTYGVVGTVSSDGSITFGTAAQIGTKTAGVDNASVYSTTDQKGLLIITDANDYRLYAYVITISGTSFSVGAEVEVGDTNLKVIKASGKTPLVYCSNNSKFLLTYRDVGNSNYGTAIAGNISGTSTTWGTKHTILSNLCTFFAGAFITASSKTGVIFYNANSGNINYVIMTVDNSLGITQGSIDTFKDVNTSNFYCAYDSTSARFISVVKNEINASSLSGTTLTKGAYITLGSEATVPAAITYNSNLNRSVVFIYGFLYNVSVSGTTCTLESTSTAPQSNVQNNQPILGSPSNLSVFLYKDNASDSDGTALAYVPAAITSSSFVGITEAAISDTATGTVTLQGGINTTADLGTSSSTFNTAVEVAGDGTAGSILYDPTNNKVIALYADGDNSNYGTAKVGTVSGTSTSWGSATVFESATATQIHSVYDVNAQRVVVVYQDGGNSSYPTVVIGTVAGTGISFGSPVVALSSSANIEVTYDAGQQKCLVTYRPASNSIFLMVGTVSGTSISFGSPLTVSSTAVGGINGIVYDANAAKSVLFWGTGLNAEAAVATISGTSVSVGSTVQYSSGTNLQRGSAVYDSVAQKVVTVAKNSNNDDSTANVGTVSGTSISFGTEVIADSTINQSGESAIVYDVAQNKILYVFGGNPGSGQRMYSQVGAVSGTTTTWSTPVELATNYHYVWGLAYNSSTASNVLLYSDNGSADILEAQVATIAQDTLTIGSTYYVQSDGTLGTGSTSIVAGEAISATSINLVNT